METMTVNEAAGAAKVTAGRIRQLCAEPKPRFVAVRTDGEWRIERRSFEEWKANRRPGRAPGRRYNKPSMQGEG